MSLDQLTTTLGEASAPLSEVKELRAALSSTALVAKTVKDAEAARQAVMSAVQAAGKQADELRDAVVTALLEQQDESFRMASEPGVGASSAAGVPIFQTAQNAVGIHEET